MRRLTQLVALTTSSTSQLMNRLAEGDNYMIIEVCKEYCKDIPGLSERFPPPIFYALRLLESASKDESLRSVAKHEAQDG